MPLHSSHATFAQRMKAVNQANIFMGIPRFSRAAVFLAVFVLASCSYAHDVTTTEIDPSGHLYRQDYQGLRDRGDNNLPDDAKTPPPIPESAEDVTPPPAPMPAGSNRLVSVSVTDSVPLRDVLMELARETKVNLELDPRIQGGIIFTAHEQPFNEVLKRICSMAGLRSTADGNFIHIELDDRWTPETQSDDVRVIDVSADDVKLGVALSPGGAQREVVLKPYQTYRLSTGEVEEGPSAPVPDLSR